MTKYSRTAYDKIINQEVVLPDKGELNRGTVRCRTEKDGEGHVGTYNDNPYHNTVTYDVVFEDGTTKEYCASTIAENMFRQSKRHLNTIFWIPY